MATETFELETSFSHLNDIIDTKSRLQKSVYSYELAGRGKKKSEATCHGVSDDRQHFHLVENKLESSRNEAFLTFKWKIRFSSQ